MKMAAELGAELRNAEDGLKALYCKIMTRKIKEGVKSVAAGEYMVGCDTEYLEALQHVAGLRKQAELAKADADYLLKRWETWRTCQASSRAAARV